MDNSSARSWPLVKLALEQADVVLNALNKVLDTMPSNSSQNTLTEDQKKLISSASQTVSLSLQDEAALKRAAEDIDFQSLAESLRAVEIPIDAEEIAIATALLEEASTP